MNRLLRHLQLHLQDVDRHLPCIFRKRIHFEPYFCLWLLYHRHQRIALPYRCRMKWRCMLSPPNQPCVGGWEEESDRFFFYHFRHILHPTFSEYGLERLVNTNIHRLAFGSTTSRNHQNI